MWWLLASLVISMAAILILIVAFKFNAAISLVIGSLVMGALAGMPMSDAIGAINTGFGEMMRGIGLPIGFGIILGQLVADSGGAQVIAERLVKIFPESKAIYAIAFAAFILAIPVYFDVTFVILIPIGVALMRVVNRSIVYIVGAITIGAATSHTLVPPTPAPLAAGEIFGFDIGILVVAGAIFGTLIVFLVTRIYIFVLDRAWLAWDRSADESGRGTAIKVDTVCAASPSLLRALLPICTPVLLILTKTIASAITSQIPSALVFLGDKTTALLAGALVAYITCIPSLGWKEAQESANRSLTSLGVVLLITGAGGAFSQIITESGVADAISQLASGFAHNIWVVLLIAYLVGLVIKQITGSGTVSALTSMTVMASVASSVSIHPVFIALACLSGTLFGATVNDSGFWVVTNLSGLSVKGGIKAYTVTEMIMSVVCLIVLLIVCAVWLLIV